jgi:hypothetical protein
LSVKIGCHCGAVIVDQTDDLPFKGHLIPDQEWFATYDAIDDQVINPIADGRLRREVAYRLARTIISRPAREMWQCTACGRLYIDDFRGRLRCFLPEHENPDFEVLRSRAKPAEQVAPPEPAGEKRSQGS